LAMYISAKLATAISSTLGIWCHAGNPTDTALHTFMYKEWAHAVRSSIYWRRNRNLGLGRDQTLARTTGLGFY
jgi:hypothetical protein